MRLKCSCGWACNVNASIELRCPRCKSIVRLDVPWPHWTRIITGRWRRPEDQGLGDSFIHMIDELGEEYVAWMMPRLGIDCGCNPSNIIEISSLNSQYTY